MIKFEKISREQFIKDASQPIVLEGNINIQELKEMMSSTINMSIFDNTFELNSEQEESVYDKIKLPLRATKCSAGYDIFSPVDFTLEPRQTLKIATGIRVILPDDKVLIVVPRSSLGFKYRLQLDNTIGVVDADYAGSDNEGHIWIKITNDSTNGAILHVKQGEAIAQGIILTYGITDDDMVFSVRNGGIGSTTETNSGRQ